jgi:hypothetical protein
MISGREEIIMYRYEYKDNMYYLIDEHGETITAHEKVALGFSYNEEDGGVLHKHGSPENVNKWAVKTRKQFMSASRDFELHKSITARGVPTSAIDYEQMAKGIVVIEGILPVKEVQKCIDILGYVGRYYEKLQKDKHET